MWFSKFTRWVLSFNLVAESGELNKSFYKTSRNLNLFYNLFPSKTCLFFQKLPVDTHVQYI